MNWWPWIHFLIFVLSFADPNRWKKKTVRLSHSLEAKVKYQIQKMACPFSDVLKNTACHLVTAVWQLAVLPPFYAQQSWRINKFKQQLCGTPGPAENELQITLVQFLWCTRRHDKTNKSYATKQGNHKWRKKITIHWWFWA